MTNGSVAHTVFKRRIGSARLGWIVSYAILQEQVKVGYVVISFGSGVSFISSS